MKRQSVFVLAIGIVLILAGKCGADLSDGLIAFYPFSSNANDQSGYGHDGMVYGATLSTNRFGNTDMPIDSMALTIIFRFPIQGGFSI